jgi:hypothetical protein
MEVKPRRTQRLAETAEQREVCTILRVSLRFSANSVVTKKQTQPKRYSSHGVKILTEKQDVTQLQ